MATAAIDEPTLVRLTVDDYQLLCKAHAHDEPVRTELIDGEIFRKNEFGSDGDPVRQKLTIADFNLLVEAGAFRRYAQTELIDGVVVEMNAQHRPHAFAKSRLAFRLQDRLKQIGSALEVVTEGSVAFEPYDEPQPDIILTDAALEEGPIPGETIRLLIEVSDATVRHDRTVKLRVYANAGVPEYWVVNVPGRRVHRYWQPVDTLYCQEDEHLLGGEIDSVTIPGLVVSTHDLTIN